MHKRVEVSGKLSELREIKSRLADKHLRGKGLTLIATLSFEENTVHVHIEW